MMPEPTPSRYLPAEIDELKQLITTLQNRIQTLEIELLRAGKRHGKSIHD